MESKYTKFQKYHYDHAKKQKSNEIIKSMNNDQLIQSVSFIPESHKIYLNLLKDYIASEYKDTAKFRDKPLSAQEIIDIEKECGIIFPCQVLSFLMTIGSFSFESKRYEENVNLDPLASKYLDEFKTGTKTNMIYTSSKYSFEKMIEEYYKEKMDIEYCEFAPKMISVYGHRFTPSLLYIQDRPWIQRKLMMDAVDDNLPQDMKLFSEIIISFLEFVEESRWVFSVHPGDTIPYGRTFFGYIIREFFEREEKSDEEKFTALREAVPKEGIYENPFWINIC